MLFVDYITEHLTPNGKAGIIVPEGIIFQSGNAYKQLRKMLVEDGLWAVVSLPQGVFNPYAGVKTSILFFNNTIAKQTKEILFTKTDNDGFDLGAQRRPIDKNDLPSRLEILNRYKKSVQENKKFSLSKDEERFASVVKKEKIAKNGDYNLSANHYLAAIDYTNAKWPMIEVGEMCEVVKGSPITQKQAISGSIPVIAGGQQPAYFHNTSNRNGDTITVSASGAYAGYVNFFTVPIFASDCSTIKSKNESSLLTRFVYFILKSQQKEIYKFQQGGGQPHVYPKDLAKIKIPLPPIEIQKEIVAELSGYQKIIDGAKQIVDNYKPTIKIDPSWTTVKLETICDVRDGTHDSPKYKLEGYPLITSKNIIKGRIDFSDVNLISKDDLEKIEKRSRVDDGDIIMPMIGTIGNPIVVKKDRDFAIKNVALIKFYKDSKIERYFLKHFLESESFDKYLKNSAAGSTQKFISLGFIRNMGIPLPPIETQEKIISCIEEEEKQINSAIEIVGLFEQKIKDKISEVWGE